MQTWSVAGVVLLDVDTQSPRIGMNGGVGLPGQIDGDADAVGALDGVVRDFDGALEQNHEFVLVADTSSERCQQLPDRACSQTSFRGLDGDVSTRCRRIVRHYRRHRILGSRVEASGVESGIHDEAFFQLPGPSGE